jgi:hypothetical protein
MLFSSFSLFFLLVRFYYFLFELLPDAKPLFTKGMKAQGRMLANVIKYIITNLRESDESVLKESLEHLARVHNARGITADQYSVMGMCLVHTVRICCGPAYFTSKHKDASVPPPYATRRTLVDSSHTRKHVYSHISSACFLCCCASFLSL